MADLSGMRIAFVAGTLGRGGAERQLYFLVRALSDAGACIDVLSLTSGEAWEEPLRALGAEVRWVGRSQSRPKRLAKIVYEVRRLEPHVVQSQHFFTNLYTGLSARWARALGLGAIRSDCYSEMAANGRVLGNMCLRWPHRLVVNSRSGIRNAEALGVARERLCYLPNVVDVNGKARNHGSGGPVVIAWVGRFSSPKRPDRLVRIAARLTNSNLGSFRVGIAGSGPLEPEARQAILERDLGGMVVFHGEIEDARELISNSDVLLLTSDYEGTPNVVLEAMASGVPVVSTNVGDAAELIKHGETGFLFDPQREADADSILTELIRDPLLRRAVGDKARDWVRAERSPQTLEGFITDLYPSLGG